MSEEELRQQILNNLSIYIDTETEQDYGDSFTIFKVSIYWGDTKIDTASTSIRTK